MTDLVADRSYGLEVPAGGIFELPVLVPLSRIERARVTAAHRDDHVGRLDDLLGPRLRVLTGDVDADLGHRRDRTYAALADPVRLRLLSLIADAGEICACDLLAPLGKAQPTVSHHTKVLADVGLIVGEKRGRWVWWSLVPERVAELRRSLDTRAIVHT